MEPIYLSFPKNPEVLQTVYIQAALDTMKDTGGELILGAGQWQIASLLLYSGVTLHLSAGCQLIGSKNIADYTDFHIDSTLGYLKSEHMCREWNLPRYYVNAMITAVNAEDVSVIGDEGSVIDGSDCFDSNGEEHFRGPMGMVFSRCTNVTLKGYTIRNTANWAHQLDSCRNVEIEGLTILGGHDGVNLHHCTGIVANNCDIRSGDDCFAGYDVENLLVRNCRLNTSCNSFRIGGRDIRVEDCAFWGPGEYPHRVSGRHNTLAAFMYYAMWYDTIRSDSTGWVIRNCSFDGIDRLFIYDHALWDHAAQPLRDITMEHVTVKNLYHGSILRPEAGRKLSLHVRDFSLSWRENGPYDCLSVTDDVEISMKNFRIQAMNC